MHALIDQIAAVVKPDDFANDHVIGQTSDRSDLNDLAFELHRAVRQARRPDLDRRERTEAGALDLIDLFRKVNGADVHFLKRSVVDHMNDKFRQHLQIAHCVLKRAITRSN